MTITLVGYRGTGKSTLARELAARLHCEAIDADAEIEARAGSSIREIFAAEGEAGFRHREREVMAELLGRDQLVVAAGGGAVLDRDTRRLMREAGTVIWLQAAAEVIHQRLALDASTAARRPALTASPPLEEIRALLAVREPHYREVATFAIDTDGRTVAEILEDALSRLPDFSAQKGLAE